MANPLHEAWSNFTSTFDGDYRDVIGQTISLDYSKHRPSSKDQSSPLRKAWIDFAASFGGEAVTLNYNNVFGAGTDRLPITRTVRLEEVQRDLNRLDRNVNKKMYGKWSHLPGSSRMTFMAFVENASSNIHVHGIWHAPPSDRGDFITMLDEQWSKLVEYGSIHVEPVQDSGWSRYIQKQMHKYQGGQTQVRIENDDFDRLIMSRTITPL